MLRTSSFSTAGRAWDCLRVSLPAAAGLACLKILSVPGPAGAGFRRCRRLALAVLRSALVQRYLGNCDHMTSCATDNYVALTFSCKMCFGEPATLKKYSSGALLHSPSSHHASQIGSGTDHPPVAKFRATHWHHFPVHLFAPLPCLTLRIAKSRQCHLAPLRPRLLLGYCSQMQLQLNPPRC